MADNGDRRRDVDETSWAFRLGAAIGDVLVYTVMWLAVIAVLMVLARGCAAVL